MVSCIGCPQGYFGEIVGAQGNKYAVCSVCEPGRFQPIGYDVHTGVSYHTSQGKESTMSWTCQACPFGYKQTAAAARDCDPCPSGLVSGEGTRSECAIPCPKGRYLNNPDGVPPKFNTPQGGLDSEPEDLCFACPAGWHNEYFQRATCDECAGGKYQDQPQSEECEECPKGWHSPNSTHFECYFCDAGTYQHLDGQVSCTDCEMGRYNRAIPAHHDFVYVEASDPNIGDWLTNDKCSE